MKYIKKAIPIEAVQWFRHGDHPAVDLWPGNIMLGCIKTAEGSLEVRPGTWIVGPGAIGEYWPVRDEVFRATYEPHDLCASAAPEVTL